jgi:hypothetical protein
MFVRLEGNPIIRPEMLPAGDGESIAGPSLVRAPSWIRKPLGRYYLYFAHHQGQYIRLAYADRLSGPWTVYRPGTLRLDQTVCRGHIASPDVHVDEREREVRMYFHGPIAWKPGEQTTFQATSPDGISFTPRSEELGRAYFRVFEWGGRRYAVAMRGWLYQASGGDGSFYEVGRPLDPKLRHAALMLEGDVLSVFYSRIGDTPECILRVDIELTPDARDWEASSPVVVLEPEEEWEGARLPLEPSRSGAPQGPVRQLRDPAIFQEHGKTFLLYSVAGESGIAITEVGARKCDVPRPRRTHAPPHFDVIGISDLTFLGGTALSIVEEVKAQHALGWRTGVAQVKSPILNGVRAFHPAIRSCLQTGQAELLDIEQHASATAVVIRSPRAFLGYRGRGPRIETDLVVMVANHSHFDTRGDRPWYAVDPVEVDEWLRSRFRAPVFWAPIGPVIRAELEELEPPLQLLDGCWYNVIDVDAWAKDRSRFVEDRPVIGRHGRDDTMKWPESPELLLDAYPDDPRFRVKILGGEQAPEGILGRIPENWTIYPFNSISPRRFLHEIDYFVYYHDSRWVEAFGRSILEALASGCLTILPPHFEDLFRDACTYAEPSEVRSLVLEMHEAPDRYRRLVERATARTRERFGYGEHQRRLRDLIGSPTRADSKSPSGVAGRRKGLLLLVGACGDLQGWLLGLVEELRLAWSPVFVSLVPDFSWLPRQGHQLEYLPDHSWAEDSQRGTLRSARLAELINRYDARAVALVGELGASDLVDAVRDSGIPAIGISTSELGHRQGSGPVPELVIDASEVTAREAASRIEARCSSY